MPKKKKVVNIFSVHDVAESAGKRFRKVIHPEAVSIFTPFTNLTPLANIKIKKDLKKFMPLYEPKTEKNGLYPHQTEFFREYGKNPKADFIVTSATGSGKSLCFWAWTFEDLLSNPEATALLCFPTQALMYGQAERMARISVQDSLNTINDITYGGQIKVGSKSVGWTVWKGVGWKDTRDNAMSGHVQTACFKNARIRIATLDKAHYSLMQDVDFTKHLTRLVLDEAHYYGGMFGANVLFFLKRVFSAVELCGRQRPSVFLSSATLSDAKTFGKKLLSLDENENIVHIEDATKQDIQDVTIEEALAKLKKPPAGGLFRTVLLLDEGQGDVDLVSFLSEPMNLGNSINLIYFVESKFYSKKLSLEINPKYGKKRSVILYDGDLPPLKRREIEATFNSGSIKGATLLATIALELGVDIEGLDVCVIDKLPAARQALLQRIGRVGRRGNAPGLVILKASLDPMGRCVIRDPKTFFQLDTNRALPIPDHLDMIRWKHLIVAYQEGLYRNYSGKDWGNFSTVITKYFGECPALEELKKKFEDTYGDVVEMGGSFWAHKGFRASASQGKIPLLEYEGKDGDGNPEPRFENGQRCDVSWIEDTSLFRDAHPEGVFLGHDGRRWRIVAYKGEWKVAKNLPPDTDYVLAKWLKTITAVFVEEIKDRIATRGEWQENHELYEKFNDLPERARKPNKGKLIFGTWDYQKRWDGYRQLDLNTGKSKRVSMADVSKRFWQAVEDGKNFPYLHWFTYRTFGWRWEFGKLKKDFKNETELNQLTVSLLEIYISNQLECNISDLSVNLSFKDRHLTVFETVPGGNGLSIALTTEDRMPNALKSCIEDIGKFAKERSGKRFKRYIAQVLNKETEIKAKEVLDAVKELNMRWQG